MFLEAFTTAAERLAADNDGRRFLDNAEAALDGEAGMLLLMFAAFTAGVDA
jgi:hypothetical protein